MKQGFAFLVPMAIWLLLTETVWAQNPEKMSYQAVIRDASDNLVTSQTVGMQINAVIQLIMLRASVPITWLRKAV